MRFIKLNFRSGRKIVFCLNDVRWIENQGTKTRLTIGQDETILFDIHIDDLCNKMYDIGLDTEENYELIEISERDYGGIVKLEEFLMNE